ncbi:MAG: D,D-dipeptide ABC transporter permease, partial [Thermoprotei archaeon]
MKPSTKTISISLRSEKYRKMWFRFSRNPLSVAGLTIVITIILLGVLAPFIAPYPEHAGWYVNFDDALKPPSLKHLFGTDKYGRDVFSRVLFGIQYSLFLAAVVLSIVVPVGSILGLIAGYFRGTIIEYIIMRACDIFVAVPPLVMALAIASVLK